MSASDTLKRFQNALRGARLSGTAAHEINMALSALGPYRSFCSMDEKLPGIYKDRLQAIVDDMLARGVVPSTSLLTPLQRKAMQK